MNNKTNIEWADYSWNPWHGCHKVSEGCKYCYMYRNKAQYGQNPNAVVRSKTQFKKPLSIKYSSIIFTCSWSDFFIEEADLWRTEAWNIIKQTPQHTFLILTKRPERILPSLPEDWGDGYNNVFLGVSVENKKHVDRIKLLDSVLSKYKFLSIEPILDHIWVKNFIQRYDWVIVGGESGNTTGKYKFRPANAAWFYHIINEGKLHNTPVFVKQLGTYISNNWVLKDRHGRDINEWPKHLKIRQFPKTIQALKAPIAHNK